MSEESKSSIIGQWIVVVVVVVALVVFIVYCTSAVIKAIELDQDIDDFKDDMGEGIVPDDWEVVPKTPDPGYEYSISNVQMNLTFSLEFNGTVIGVLSIHYECELYSISCLLNEDSDYDLVIDIVGLYLNASMTNDTNISGGSLIIDDLHYEGVVDDCTQDAINDALMGVADLEQWSVDA